MLLLVFTSEFQGQTLAAWTAQVPGQALICSSSETALGVAADLGVTTWLRLG